ncbi:serine protease [Orbilia ellipsospora]|uniref:Serine protease n=1 Tax=Orbilia ellipsospora TaxID=2528407 RepID=A0AAV9X2N0_9PEZI
MKSTFTILLSVLAPAALAVPFAANNVSNSTQQPLAKPLGANVAQEKAPWHLARISAPSTDKDVYSSIEDGIYYHDSRSGLGVDAYIIDANIYPGHPDFVNNNFTMISKFAVTKDKAGHGTQMAGVLGGKKYGVAKNVKLTGCSTRDGDIHGCIPRIIKIHQQKMAEKKANPAMHPNFVGSVISISLGFTEPPEALKSKKALNATIAAIKAGIHVVASAGNDGKDACLGGFGNISPLVPELIVVGATTKRTNSVKGKDAPGGNEIAGYSNRGRCVSIYAPGSVIPTTDVNDGYGTSTGTSPAAPMVAGVVAEMMVRHPKLSTDPKAMKDFLLGKSTGPNAGRKGVIKGAEELNFLYNGIHES